MDPTERNIHAPKRRRELTSYLASSYAVAERIGILEAIASAIDIEAADSQPTWILTLIVIVIALPSAMSRSQ
jgi:hypothetical protein